MIQEKANAQETFNKRQVNLCDSCSCFFTAIAIAAFPSGTNLSIATAVVSEVLFRLEGNTGIVWDALGSKGPGYSKLQVLAYEGDKWKQPGILIIFQVEIDTTETPLLSE